MKYILAALLMIVGHVVQAQQLPVNQVPTQFSTGYFKQGWHKADSGHVFAVRDTNFTPRYAGTTILWQNSGVDTAQWIWTGVRWIKNITTITPSPTVWGSITGTLSNQTDLQSALDTKLNISDTTDKWVYDIYRRGDSVFYSKGGDEVFAYIDSTSGGGGSGTVTSVDLSMPSAFSVSGNPITSSGTINVSGAGTTLQYIRGNGTLATMDTSAIPSFYLKTRSLFSGTSPLQYNSTTGAFSILDATTTQKGVASFNASDFDVSSGAVSLIDVVTAGSCTGCGLNIDSKGRVVGYSSGPGGATNNTNIGSGFRILNEGTQEMRTLFSGFGTRIDSVANEGGLTVSTDSTRGEGVPTYFYLDSLVSNSSSGDLVRDSTGIGVIKIGDSTVIFNTGVGGVYDSTFYAYPGDTLQRIVELAESVPGNNRVMIMPGLHELPLDTLDAIMYVSRSDMSIEFAAGAHVKIADNSNHIIDSVEIARNYYPIVGLDDISARTTDHPPVTDQSIIVTITSTGTPDQFTVSNAASGNGVYNMTGDWQTIGTTGIDVKFDATTGHTINDAWYLLTSATPATVLRIGEGFQEDTIKNIRVIGSGILDGNYLNQHMVNELAAESNYTLGIIGRVSDVTIDGVTLINGERSLFASGRHTGTFNINGTTTGGESYDVSDLKILNTTSKNNFAGILLGHPAYRGYTKNVIVSSNTIYADSGVAIEPNHRLSNFSITNNYIQGPIGSVYMWRAPDSGYISNNVLVGPIADRAPNGWYRSSSVNVRSQFDSLPYTDVINRRMGINTRFPDGHLHIQDNGALSGSNGANIRFAVKSLPTAGGQRLGFLAFGSRNGGTDAFNGALIGVASQSGWSTGSWPTDIYFETNPGGTTARTERLRIKHNGFIGIGISTPNFPLHVNGANTNGMAVQNTQTLGTASGGFVRMYNTGTPSAADQRLGGLLWGTNPTGTTFRNSAQLEARSDGIWTDNSSHPTYLSFCTTPASSTTITERMRISAAGGLFINATTGANIDTRRLYVNGSVGINKDSTIITSNISGNYILLQDTVSGDDLGRIKRVLTLPISKGGTGLTSLGGANQQLRVNSGGTALEYFTPDTYESGTYTPTLTNVSGIASSTSYQCQYMRVGNVVTVSGKVDIDPSAPTSVIQLGISLPIASAVPNEFNCGGTGASGLVAGYSGSIRADSVNDRAELDAQIGADEGNNSWFFTFTYLIDNS